MMDDRSAFWQVQPDWAAVEIQTEALTAHVQLPIHQVLVSGRIETLLARGGLPDQAIGAFDIARGDPYAVRLARDRMLLVGENEIELRGGWHETGFAVTDMTDGYIVIDVRGWGVGDLIARGTSIPATARGPSASLRFAGFDVAAYRYEEENRLRFHVEAAHAAGLWWRIEDIARQIELVG